MFYMLPPLFFKKKVPFFFSLFLFPPSLWIAGLANLDWVLCVNTCMSNYSWMVFLCLNMHCCVFTYVVVVVFVSQCICPLFLFNECLAPHFIHMILYMLNTFVCCRIIPLLLFFLSLFVYVFVCLLFCVSVYLVARLSIHLHHNWLFFFFHCRMFGLFSPHHFTLFSSLSLLFFCFIVVVAFFVLSLLLYVSP
jgi:hypothetical protein